MGAVHGVNGASAILTGPNRPFGLTSDRLSTPYSNRLGWLSQSADLLQFSKGGSDRELLLRNGSIRAISHVEETRHRSLNRIRIYNSHSC